MGLIMWLVLIAAATPLRGAEHLTELGTTWHDNDRIVRPLIGLAVGVLGCILAKLLARAVGLPDFRGQVDYVLRRRICQASSNWTGLVLPMVECLRRGL